MLDWLKTVIATWWGEPPIVLYKRDTKITVHKGEARSEELGDGRTITMSIDADGSTARVTIE